MGGAGSGRGGLSVDAVKECLRLAALGWSSDRIARRLEVNVTTVRRIRRGEHFLQQLMDLADPRYARCGCGALTDEQPCRLCQLRRAGL